MNYRQIAALAVSTLLLASPISASAGEFYIGASIGNATLSEDFDGLNIDDNSTAFRLVGGWNFNDYFSLEAGYHDFGDFEQTFDTPDGPVTARLGADGFLFGAIGHIPLSERFTLSGRAGMFFWNGTAEINDVSQASPEDNNLFLGAGVMFDVTDRFKLTTDWTRYELEDVNSSVFSVGFQYRFR
jgi:OOP family OmpA-OmpF porin